MGNHRCDLVITLFVPVRCLTDPAPLIVVAVRWKSRKRVETQQNLLRPESIGTLPFLLFNVDTEDALTADCLHALERRFDVSSAINEGE